MEAVKNEKIFIIGARRGLGKEILKQWREQFPQDQIVGSSRKEFSAVGIETVISDMSSPAQLEELLTKIKIFTPSKVFYIAGGGPYGNFADKSWKDHQWALQVSLLSPMQVMHFCLNLESVRQIVVVGSNIAESKADPGAASYAAAKHGLKGCISSLQSESSKDLRLFSPGYMSTDMLPQEAQNRINGPIDSPEKVAKLFIDWVQNPKASWHWEGRP